MFSPFVLDAKGLFNIRATQVTRQWSGINLRRKVPVSSIFWGISDDLRFLRDGGTVQVGPGCSCSVYRTRKADDGILVRDITRSTRGVVAIKEICISSLPRKNILIDEIVTLKQANHRNIISFHDVVWQSGSNNVLDCDGVRGLWSVVRFDW
jgi:hypothetical protein